MDGNIWSALSYARMGKARTTLSAQRSRAPTVTVGNQKRPPLHKPRAHHTSTAQTPLHSSQRHLRLLDNMPKNKGKVRTVFLWDGGAAPPRLTTR